MSPENELTKFTEETCIAIEATLGRIKPAEHQGLEELLTRHKKEAQDIVDTLRELCRVVES